MAERSLRQFRRPFLALALAALLPTLVSVSVAVFMYLHALPARLQADAVARSHTIMDLVDSRLSGDAAMLNVMSSSLSLLQHQWPDFYVRLQGVLRATPPWRTIKLYDVEHQQEIFDLRRPFGAPLSQPLSGVDMAALNNAKEPIVGGLHSEGNQQLIYLYMPVRSDDRLTYVLIAGIDPEIFQRILMRNSAKNVVSAVVDRQGLFIARNVDYQKRLGTPATHFVRDALKRANSGVYRGVTYEGLPNVAAFITSPLSGWSTHIALASESIDILSTWSLAVVAVALLISTGLGVLLVRVVVNELEERRRNDEALRQSQKMEAVGQLTGGIAHDFNNLLTPIIGNLDLIRLQSKEQPRMQRLAQNALEAARRGAKLSAQLLAFSRVQRLRVRPVNLPELLTGMTSLLQQSLGPTIVLRMDIDAEAQQVSCDPHQLELALINVAVNARDAMPGGGSFTIATRRVNKSRLPQLNKGSYVEICSTDTGMGMSEAVRVRAMEPFFTTKPVGQGTGMGLAQVYGIVRESGGAVEIVSTEQVGTSVCLYLPMAESVTPSVNSPAMQATVPSKASILGKILVVDDDPEVRTFLRDALLALGYEVTAVGDGVSALRTLQQGDFTLLIVDFAMAKMNGVEVARQAQQTQPALRVLLISGYADSAAIATASHKVQLLQKPFGIDEFKAAVSAALS